MLAVAGLSILSGRSGPASGSCQESLAHARQSRDRGNNANALHWAKSGETLCRADGVKQWWRLRLVRAEAETALGFYRAASQSLEPAMPQDQSFSNFRAHRFLDQAWVAIYMASYDAAANMLRQAEEEANQARPFSAARISAIAFGKLYLYGLTGDADAARRARDQIIRTGSYVERDLSAASGWSLNKTQHFEEAALYFESAIKGSSSNNPLRTGQLENNLAGIYYHLGDFDQAMHAALLAEPALRKGADSSGLRVCLNTIGLIDMDLGDYAKAKTALQESLQLATQLGEAASKPEVLNNLTSVAIAMNDWAQADAFNHQAMELGKNRDLAESAQYSLIAKARIQAGRRDFAGALSMLDQATAQPLMSPLRIDAEVEYLSIFRKLNDETKAWAHYRAALAMVDAVRSKMRNQENQLAWYSSQIALHQEWVRFLMEQNHVEEALESVEWSRARLMMERLENASATPAPTRSASAYRKLAREQGAVLISYWLAPDSSYAWVIRSNRIDVLKLPDEQSIASAVARYQIFIQDGNDPEHSSNTAAAELVRAILTPLLPAIGSARRVILVPDGQLHGLNFETLPVNGQYWIHDVTIAVAPSLNILLTGERASGVVRTTPRMLVIGDPDPAPEFRKLPSAAGEMASVARSFPGGTVLRGAEATPTAYLQAAAHQDYIHFAAHASAIAERPLDSAVILSPDAHGNSDGRLTARDLLNQPSRAELVTISACRSAGVRSYRGEGPVGLAWVFLQSGARGVIAGLWDADDAATAGLMSVFYERLARGEYPPDALRQAKLAMLSSGSHFSQPYYWASFQYYQGAGHAGVKPPKTSAVM